MKKIMLYIMIGIFMLSFMIIVDQVGLKKLDEGKPITIIKKETR